MHEPSVHVGMDEATDVTPHDGACIYCHKETLIVITHGLFCLTCHSAIGETREPAA